MLNMSNEVDDIFRNMKGKTCGILASPSPSPWYLEGVRFCCPPCTVVRLQPSHPHVLERHVDSHVTTGVVDASILVWDIASSSSLSLLLSSSVKGLNQSDMFGAQGFVAVAHGGRFLWQFFS